MTSYYEIYRGSSIGMSLTDALDDLISTGAITPPLALRVLAQFDKSVTEALPKFVKPKATLKGHLKNYNNYAEVWTLDVRNPTFKMESNEVVSADRVKIVAVPSKHSNEAAEAGKK
ncbi:hypothetical protein HGRIS_000407 [Hohenbuehelia grisea]|uniref:Transcription initiation factor IIA subunit 2 n=1 Tax=Hohenbuehelia grisea TaxID=104357 RepID=A0ABR3JRK9_9AGAR